MQLHSKEQIKELSNLYDYSLAIMELQSKFPFTSNLTLEIRRVQMILNEELSKYKHLIGAHVSYKGVFAKQAKTGKITAILHFFHSGVIVRVDYDINGFDTMSLTDLAFLRWE